jgi:MoaA/NifB/PqqE/SkfB family radical SAM enzyme
MSRPTIPVDFSHAPALVIWEATRACDLACRHCRAEAQPAPLPGELNDAEALAMLDEVRREFGPVILVITGGDPLKRPGLERIIAHGSTLGLTMAMTPSATPLLTVPVLARLRAAGLQRLALSLDGADAATHDGFRGVPGTFARTIELLQEAPRFGLTTQINTTVTRPILEQIPAIRDLCAWLDVSQWSLFMVVPTGRAEHNMLPSPGEHERLYRQVATWALDPGTTMMIKTTAGQPYYRVLEQERQRRHLPPPRFGGSGVNDGNGFVFVSCTGEICPSGFLATPCGDVRHDGLARTYREHPLFAALRRPEGFSGKCAVCPHNHRCGGSRSRAYALTGDALGSDPTCAYIPAAYAEATRLSA